jgi:hypothetical protein
MIDKTQLSSLCEQTGYFTENGNLLELAKAIWREGQAFGRSEMTSAIATGLASHLPSRSCKICNTKLTKGVAIINTLTGIPDFPGDANAVTVSPGGPGSLVDVLKCPKCGWSCFA